jgi:hypothetical protein
MIVVALVMTAGLPYLIVTCAVVACGGATAESPITVTLGAPREQVIRDLEAKHRYCAKAEHRPAPTKTDVYPRCDRPGAEWGESWIAAKYEDGKLVELKRYERFSDEARAVERWNQLVGERTKLAPESAEATAALRGRPLEPGTRSMKAFRVDATTAVGVYLLTPTPPEDASILEAIVQIK